MITQHADPKTLTEASQAALQELAEHTTTAPDGFDLKFSEKEAKAEYRMYGNYGRGYAHC